MKEWQSWVFLDMVNSTKMEELYPGCKDKFRNIADRIFEGFKGCGWHGEGTAFSLATFFFKNADDVIRASIKFIEEIRFSKGAEIRTRIAIASGLAEKKEEIGKIDARFIDIGGHLLSECPENSILITEDTFDTLSEELKEKFILFGTTKREKEIAFIFPKERAKIDDKDPAFSYRAYLEGAERFLKKLPSLTEGMPQFDLLDIFYPLKAKRRERRLVIKRQDAQATPVMDRFESYSESPPYPFNEIFRKEKHIIILGDPGSGKTTLIKWLFLIHSQGTKAIIDNDLGEKRLFPIILPIPAICIQKKEKGYLSPIDVICGYTKEFGGLSPSFLEERLKKGGCLILLDGLDEVYSSAERFEMTDYISRFISVYPENRFVITSRIIGFCEIPGLDEVYTLSELEDEDIKGLSCKWFAQLYGEVKKAKEEGESLARSLMGSATRELAKSPFLLTLILYIHATGHRLPKYRARLYRQCCELLFERWPASNKRKEPPMEYDDAERYLASLGLWMQRETKGLVERDDLKKKIREIMKDKADELFFWLTRTTQLLIEKGGNKWGFMHMSLQEFLSAVALYKKDEYSAWLKDNSYNPHWREVFLLLSGYINIYGKENELPSIIKGLISRDDDLEQILHKNLLLAGEIIVELELKDKMGEEIIDKIFSLALESEYSPLEEEAVYVLKKAKGAAEKRLLEILRDKEKGVIRERAARALGKIGSEESISHLTAILEDKGEDEGVRRWAAEALGKIGSEESISHLTAILEDKGEDEGVRRWAACALGEIGSEESIPFLTAILEDKGEDKWRRIWAAWALGKIGSEKSIPQLTAIVGDKGEHEGVRRWTALALGMIGSKESIPHFTAILEDKGEDRWVRERTAWALGKIGSEESISHLTAILEDKGEDAWVRREAVLALGEIGSEESIPHLTAILEDEGEDEEVRGGAAEALGEIGKLDSSVILTLKKLIIQKEEDLWVPAIASFVRCGGRIPNLKETIIKGLNSPSLNSDDKDTLFNTLLRLVTT